PYNFESRQCFGAFCHAKLTPTYTTVSRAPRPRIRGGQGGRTSRRWGGPRRPGPRSLDTSDPRGVVFEHAPAPPLRRAPCPALVPPVHAGGEGNRVRQPE